MREFVIKFKDPYQTAVRRDYGWFVKAKSKKELTKRWEDRLECIVEVKPNDVLRTYIVVYRFWGFSSPLCEFDRSEREFTARCGAEAIEMLFEDFPPMLGTLSILEVKQK